MIDWSEGPQYASDFVKILKSYSLVEPSFKEDDSIPEAIDGIDAVDAISNLSMAIHKAMARLNEAAILMSTAEQDSEKHDQWMMETKSLMTHLNYLINGKVEVKPENDQMARNQEVVDLVKAIQEKKMVSPSPASESSPKRGKVLSFGGSGRTMQ
jgi:predicted patatin/cPLA2 family phospholipase